MSSRLIVLAAIAAVALTGCGKRGTLERPPPLWGDKARADYDAQRKADKADKEDGRDAGQQRTGPDRERIRAQPPESQNTTIAQDPLDGLPSDPRGGSGQPGNLDPHR